MPTLQGVSSAWQRTLPTALVIPFCYNGVSSVDRVLDDRTQQGDALVNPCIHKLTLFSRARHGKRPALSTLAPLLDELLTAVRYSASMRLRSRSTQKGKRPAWLTRAADVRLIDLQGDEHTHLFFEAPPLGDAAPEFYTQKDLFWTPPDAEDSVFDLFGDVLSDVGAQNADSERFDLPLLRQMLRFAKVFDDDATAVQLEGRRLRSDSGVRLSPIVLQSAERLLAETPSPRRVRVVGVLDTVRASSQTFALRIDKEEVRGVLMAGEIAELARLLNRRILAFGRAMFRPSGRLLRIDADDFRVAVESDEFFATVPRPMGVAVRKQTPLQRKEAAEGLRAVIGKWPGDETDEQVATALKEIG